MLATKFLNPGNMSTIFSAQSKNKRDGIKSVNNSSIVRLRLGWKCGAVGSEKKKEQVELEAEVVPKHIAIIMDGNRRWAANRGLPVPLGHRAGGKVLKQLARFCMKSGVEVLSLFSFSTENWIRPEEEVDYIMGLLEEITASDIHELITKDDMRVKFVGNRRRLPMNVQNAMQVAEESSKGNNGMCIVVAANYSGRYDIAEATKKIATKVKHGVLQVEDIDGTLIEQQLETNVLDFPNPDLLIRTSGELRISNYMLWQLAYTELFFCDKLFPDFSEEDLLEAIFAFQKRQRRLGGGGVNY